MAPSVLYRATRQIGNHRCKQAADHVPALAPTNHAKVLCARSPSSVNATNSVLLAVAGPMYVATSAASGASRFSLLSTNPRLSARMRCNRKLFFLPCDVIPCFPEVLFDFVRFLPGLVLHLEKRCTSCSIIGIGKIESGQERTPTRAHLGRCLANARHSGAGTGPHPRDCGTLIHPARPSLWDVL